MMRLTFFATMLFFITSCGSPASDNSDAAAQQETASTAMEASGVPMSGDNYSITVIDSEPASPRKEMQGTIADTEVVVNYGSPSVKGRTIWGDLEQYGAVWRAGANEATRITFEQGVLVAGEALEPGTYGLFVIPREAEDWTVIFNTQAEQWGAYEYDESKDVLRVDVSPVMEDANQEQLEYYIEGNTLVMRWAKVALPISIEAAMQ